MLTAINNSTTAIKKLKASEFLINLSAHGFHLLEANAQKVKFTLADDTSKVIVRYSKTGVLVIKLFNDFSYCWLEIYPEGTVNIESFTCSQNGDTTTTLDEDAARTLSLAYKLQENAVDSFATELAMALTMMGIKNVLKLIEDKQFS